MIHRYIYWVPAIFYAALIFTLSHQSDPVGAEMIPDYLAHFIEYAILALTLVFGFTAGFARPLTYPSAALAWVIALLYGLSDELHQSFVPDRHVSGIDLAADGLGALIALMLVLAANRGKWR